MYGAFSRAALRAGCGIARGRCNPARRLLGENGVHWAEPAHRRALLERRPGVRCREEGRDQGVREPHGHHAAGGRRTCVPTSTTTGTAVFWALRWTRTFRPRTSSTRSTPMTHRSAVRRRSTTTSAAIPPARAARSAGGCRESCRTARSRCIIEDWCQQYPSHSTGSLAFGPDGKLYASGGDGASFNWVDFGQGGGRDQPLRRSVLARAARCEARTSGPRRIRSP